MNSKRDFVWVQGNTIFVSNECRECNGTETIDTGSITSCSKCHSPYYLSIRHAKVSYPKNYVVVLEIEDTREEVK